MQEVGGDEVLALESRRRWEDKHLSTFCNLYRSTCLALSLDRFHFAQTASRETFAPVSNDQKAEARSLQVRPQLPRRRTM
uniref:HDC01715 n=1 Tax=Drosophila melanogaster TaxID=7227 RepID=Q6IHQ2_DROME|nr:TPA_inf: HDC01715 [Drosophila melanogaster]